jgi:hypothetical protein
MLARNAFLYGVSLVLSIGTTAEVVRADALDRDGLAANFIAKPASPSGVLRQSSADPNDRLRAHSCEELWYQRNAILWSAGYCFRESRAVRVFGNAACAYDRVYEVPLTGEDSRLVSLLELTQSAKGCVSK